MTQSPATTPDIGATLDSLLPRLRVAQALGWLGTVASAVVGLYLLTRFFGGAQGGANNLTGIGMGLCLLGAVYSPILTRRAHEAALMPVLAQALDLTYQPKAPGFARTLPERLLPRDAQWFVDALISGRIASRQVRFAEVTIKTKGKNSRTLFKGVVIEFENSIAIPAFFIALSSETESGFLQWARLDASDLTLLREVSTFGHSYSIWVSSPERAARPDFEATIAAIMAAEADLGGDGTLYSAVSDGRTTWLAFRKTQDIFRIGGLLARRDSLLTQVQRAAEDFGVPLRLVNRLLEVEANAAQNDRIVPKP